MISWHFKLEQVLTSLFNQLIHRGLTPQLAGTWQQRRKETASQPAETSEQTQTPCGRPSAYTWWEVKIRYTFCLVRLERAHRHKTLPQKQCFKWRRCNKASKYTVYANTVINQVDEICKIQSAPRLNRSGSGQQHLIYPIYKHVTPVIWSQFIFSKI